MIRWLCLGLWLLGLGLAQNTVRVVAAADLQYALTEIAQRFELRNSGLRVELTFGSSGKLYTQLMQGLPADMFFSADEAFPMQLQQAGRVEPGTLRLYAVGRLVIWASNALVQQGLDPRRLGPRILLDPRITQLAIANPMHAPYGRAGVTLLEHFGLLRSTRPVRWEEMTGGIAAYYDLGFLRRGKAGFEFVYGENISQTAQLALTSTNIGLVALSLAKSEAMERAGVYWLAPLSSHLRLNQTYVILRGQNRPEVQRFYEYMGTAEAHQVLRKYGFLLPGEKPAP
ncbi:molybdate ABC transporter substrate-binding protein [Meiothermus ruber]|jgi:molybdate transport system substrate-binding protein|uniref:Molybdenum ABC transporter substrate-binding protein n=1 Tax=Meiothermus ruber (strain ATCC 35948 / DSM 1279 / VKM B-1258 / 21) TaxID=504728 RepID=D3PT97_MEIRD|nr:molybdate ABC transporter substrate-binding protein [Meiothermus ruber]ADD28680.1 molybdenum ABC transporter, periplasmic molybdate-binding protein [Meiothermus ruber DSM 1279]AGK05875.1 molybdenum ABC transporter substrate-binding protein [Meiothermus ruber DSM 1279]MCL6530995.1 molybdate ABC transporter substrate-binding protein [Meiothermus ruber]MCX7801813.1 molybdate ABC transporter substrate-binding protein [Meiothermus ruber]GAO75640.1 molybdenum ABC transporter substrate-binding pro